MPIRGASSRRLDGVGALCERCGRDAPRAVRKKNYEMGIHFRLDHRDERP